MLPTGSPINKNKSKGMDEVFDERKDKFIQSLQNCIQAISSDLFIKQMFEDESSVIYIPNRICEIIQKTLKEDRERIIELLISQSKSFEILFGKQQYQKFLRIAQHMSQNGSQEIVLSTGTKKIFCNLLIQQIEIIQPGFSNKFKNSSSLVIKDVKSLQNISNYLKQNILITKEDLEIFKAQFLEKLKSMQGRLHKIFSALTSQIDMLQNRDKVIVQQYDILSKQYKEKEIPKIKAIYETEIKKHIEKENDLNSQLQQSRQKEKELQNKNQEMETKLQSLQSLYDSLINDS